MTSAPAIPRYILCIVVLIAFAACSRSRGAPALAAVDFIHDFDRAEKRPPTGFEIVSYRTGDVVRPSIVVPVPSRIVFPLVLPRRSAFRAFVAAASQGDDTAAPRVRLRVGVSDHRIYEGLAEAIPAAEDPRWLEVRADLGAYAGWKWSLFYQPDRITWRVVLSADTIGPVPAKAVWGSPEILTDPESAREYPARRRQLARDRETRARSIQTAIVASGATRQEN